MQSLRVFILVTLVCALAAGAQGRSLKNNGGAIYAPNLWVAITKGEMSIFERVVEVAGLKNYLSNPLLKATLFAPDDAAFIELLGPDDLNMSVLQFTAPYNAALLKELVLSLIVPGQRIYTPMWPKFPKKVWLKTLHPRNKIGLEMDDGGRRPGPDRFDVDGSDDDAELVHVASAMNLKTGWAVLQTLDDVPTWLGWKNQMKMSVWIHRNDRP